MFRKRASQQRGLRSLTPEPSVRGVFVTSHAYKLTSHARALPLKEAPEAYILVRPHLLHFRSTYTVSLCVSGHSDKAIVKHDLGLSQMGERNGVLLVQAARLWWLRTTKRQEHTLWEISLIRRPKPSSEWMHGGGFTLVLDTPKKCRMIRARKIFSVILAKVEVNGKF